MNLTRQVMVGGRGLEPLPPCVKSKLAKRRRPPASFSLILTKYLVFGQTFLAGLLLGLVSMIIDNNNITKVKYTYIT
jgi:hypothetical protein